MTDLGSRLIQSGGEAVERDGRLVHTAYVVESLPAGGWPGDPTFDDLLVEASFRPDEG